MIDFSIGDLARPLPSQILEDIFSKLDQNSIGYAPPLGIESLRHLVADRLAIGADRKIAVTAGASMAMTVCLAATCAAGAEILLPRCGFPGTVAAAEALGLRPRYYKIEEGDVVTDDEDTLCEQAVIINTPHNPTGYVETALGILAVRRRCKQSQSVLISDEVYRDLIFDDEFASPLIGVESLSVFQTLSLSKSLGLSGWRVGFLIFPREFEARISRVLLALSMCAPVPSQMLADALLRWPGLKDWQNDIRRELIQRRDYSVARLQAVGLDVRRPAAGPFLWIGLSALGVDDKTFVEIMRRCHGVIVSPGRQFGEDQTHRVRLCFGSGTNEDLVAALDAIEHVVGLISRAAATRRRAG